MKKIFNSTSTFLLIFLGVCLIWCVLSLLLFIAHHNHAEYAGTLGDTLGILNSLFSSLAFAGLVYSVIQQNRSIEKQEEEIQEGRIERSIDRFESTFFNMLQSQRDIVQEIDLKTYRKNKETRKRKVVSTTVGRECFKTFYNQHFKDSIGKIIDLKEGNFEWEEDFIYGKLELDEVIEAYEIFFEKYQNDLSHYFRHLYHIVVRIDQSKFLTREQKLNYAGIVRAQLSTYERLLLFYNGLSPYGIQLRHLIDEYQLLKGIPTNLLINRDLDKYDGFGYALSAYDESETDDESDVDYAYDLV